MFDECSNCNLNKINTCSVGKTLRTANRDRVTANSYALESSFDLGFTLSLRPTNGPDNLARDKKCDLEQLV